MPRSYSITLGHHLVMKKESFSEDRVLGEVTEGEMESQRESAHQLCSTR